MPDLALTWPQLNIKMGPSWARLGSSPCPGAALASDSYPFDVSYLIVGFVYLMGFVEFMGMSNCGQLPEESWGLVPGGFDFRSPKGGDVPSLSFGLLGGGQPGCNLPEASKEAYKSFFWMGENPGPNPGQ